MIENSQRSSLRKFQQNFNERFIRQNRIRSHPKTTSNSSNQRYHFKNSFTYRKTTNMPRLIQTSRKPQRNIQNKLTESIGIQFDKQLREPYKNNRLSSSTPISPKKSKITYKNTSGFHYQLSKSILKIKQLKLAPKIVQSPQQARIQNDKGAWLSQYNQFLNQQQNKNIKYIADNQAHKNKMSKFRKYRDQPSRMKNYDKNMFTDFVFKKHLMDYEPWVANFNQLDQVY